MSDESWDEQFKRFLRKTGEDFRRTGADISAEAQKLVEAAMDPEKQQKVRDRLNELGDWARKTAHGVAGAVGEAASKAETAFQRATDKMTPGKSDAQPAEPPSRSPRPSATGAKKAGRAKVAARGAKVPTRGKKGDAKRKR
jgi:hypothetical protein